MKQFDHKYSAQLIAQIKYNSVTSGLQEICTLIKYKHNQQIELGKKDHILQEIEDSGPHGKFRLSNAWYFHFSPIICKLVGLHNYLDRKLFLLFHLIMTLIHNFKYNSKIKSERQVLLRRQNKYRKIPLLYNLSAFIALSQLKDHIMSIDMLPQWPQIITRDEKKTIKLPVKECNCICQINEQTVRQSIVSKKKVTLSRRTEHWLTSICWQGT